MTIIYISDFDLRGSGYMNIGVNLCDQLVEQGYEVMALGLGYKRNAHDHPFTIVPLEGLQYIAPMIGQLKAHGLDIEAVVVALDIPLQEKILEQLRAPSDIPYIGIFPLEAGPLCGPWALSLLKMDARLIMSKFGQEELALRGIESEFISIGPDTQVWRPPYEQEREQIRQGLGLEDDTFIVLTVADNQERKNLSRSLEIFADYIFGFQVVPNKWIENEITYTSPTQEMLDNRKNALYWLVTRPDSPVGWKLEDYAMELGIFDRVQIWKRGMPIKNLWTLYAAADAMLLTSKAEGLAIPILEAMATRLPCIGTKCAAIEEHLSDDRGLLIDPDYVHIDPWGNSRRYMASREDGGYKLQLLRNGFSPDDYRKMLDDAQEYIIGRTWEQAGATLGQAIERVIKSRQPVEQEKELVPA